MGNIREEVEQFYLRDHVEEKVETQMIEFLSLSDLVFSRNKRVKVGCLILKSPECVCSSHVNGNYWQTGWESRIIDPR